MTHQLNGSITGLDGWWGPLFFYLSFDSGGAWADLSRTSASRLGRFAIWHGLWISAEVGVVSMMVAFSRQCRPRTHD